MAMKPIMCGKPKIHVPDDGCSECIRELNQFKNEVHQNYYTKEDTYNKTEVNELIAGVGGGGGFKLVDELPTEGEAGYIYLVPKTAPETGYEQYVWTDSGWVDLGTEELTLDKQSILTALGYEEAEIKMVDINDNEVAVTVLIAIT